jgi:hypothetical protein
MGWLNALACYSPPPQLPFGRLLHDAQGQPLKLAVRLVLKLAQKLDRARRRRRSRSGSGSGSGGGAAGGWEGGRGGFGAAGGHHLLHLAVAAQLAFESKGVKPGYHFNGWNQALFKLWVTTGFNSYSPPHLAAVEDRHRGVDAGLFGGGGGHGVAAQVAFASKFWNQEITFQVQELKPGAFQALQVNCIQQLYSPTMAAAERASSRAVHGGQNHFPRGIVFSLGVRQ